MSNLAKQECQACQVGATPLAGAELTQALQELPDWELQSNPQKSNPQPMLVRHYAFKDFTAALRFANTIGTLADKHNHHPRIMIEWGKLTVQWWTHKINNVHLTDAILAAKTDELFSSHE
ncbi:4a-hydroxytetrahydrobiopterin dehydratase [Marinagarivorans cellulosilyticus]|uniref:Putative pterin-4-alpha-carbinolamine dehydratase n=1 Tax=Marinagarivorans cellulosilyticus TaxID=2721545 RepID=A0AAN1WK73_9GAMM|nr:4a-hydroxytetrahydrobiopterin dehydratase [Marinagarivorans cellulosilyticus]BCD99089.1 4a-hydroxytetrahydrobiopterin dehydratase [Marinagarivorans cellulosilyticus]